MFSVMSSLTVCLYAGILRYVFSNGVFVRRYSPSCIFFRGALCVRLMWSGGPTRQDHQMSLSLDVGLYFRICLGYIYYII